MSFSRLDVEQAGLRERAPVMLPALGHLARVAIWSVLNAVLLFAEHLAELLAPFLLIGGVLWWARPRGRAAITLEGPANDVLTIVRNHVPHDLYIDGSYYSASVLIWDGVYLVAVVAICRTLSAAITHLLLDRG